MASDFHSFGVSRSSHALSTWLAGSRGATKLLSIPLNFDERDDGGLRITSEKLPGLLISHSEEDVARASLEPSLIWIVETKYKVKVQRVSLFSDRADIEIRAS